MEWVTLLLSDNDYHVDDNDYDDERKDRDYENVVQNGIIHTTELIVDW